MQESAPAHVAVQVANHSSRTFPMNFRLLAKVGWVPILVTLRRTVRNQSRRDVTPPRGITRFCGCRLAVGNPKGGPASAPRTTRPSTTVWPASMRPRCLSALLQKLANTLESLAGTQPEFGDLISIEPQILILDAGSILPSDHGQKRSRSR